ncbi:MAG: ABC transporter permease [Aurantibacter sp.]
MLKHNLKLFLRNIKKYKGTFAINLIGLSTGMACALLVYLWVSNELSMDGFHQNDARLYQVLRNTEDGDGSIVTRNYNSDLMLPALQQEVPGIDLATAVYEIGPGAILESNDKKLRATGHMASEDYFKVFSNNLLYGDRATALKGSNSVVISKQMADAFFDEGTNPMGKSIAIVHGEESIDDIFTVSGVFEIPENSSKNFDFLLTHKKFMELRNPDYIHWGSNSSEVFVTLNQDVDIKTFNAKIEDFITSKSERATASVFLYPYSKKYLYGRFENGVSTGGRIDYVILFSIIALFVLAIACINFMNLSTARASRRIKEIGIKKVVGAGRKSLVFQFLTESTALSLFSLICAVGLVILLLPWFNEVTGTALTFALSGRIILIIFLITFFTGLISGSYPALYLSKFRPASVLKGKISTALSELLTRKGLVIFQFSLSILLIVAVGVIYKQLDFMQSKNLGYDKDNVLIFEREGQLVKSMDTFLEEAKQIPGVINASYMQGTMTDFSNSSYGHSWPGQTEEAKSTEFWHAHVGHDLIETMGIELKEGRSYVNEIGDNETKIILNETAIKQMGLTDPIGTIIDFRGPNREIIGVVKDFHMKSLYEEIRPMALLCKTQWVNTMVVKIAAGSERDALDRLTKLYAAFNPGIAFDFRFLDSDYQALYESEKRVATLSKYFAGLAVLISCLGLFGLATFTAERRRKEISIRKVLGQSAAQVTVMLSSEFAKLVLVSISIALPIAYLLAGNWLSGFAYRIPLQLWYFVGAGLLALAVAMLTVGSQAINAANRNPVDGLREE